MESDGSLHNKSRFADYFVICGLDLTSGLEPDSFAGDNLQSTPLERPYKSKVLGHYPENVSTNPFDKDSVGMLCLPNGLQFRTQKSNLEPKFHSFVITKQDGQRFYGASFVFYEEIRNKKICSAMQTLQAMHIAELSSGRCRKTLEHNTRSLPRHFKLSSHHPKAALSYFDHTKDTLYVTKSIALIMRRPYVHAPHVFLSGLYRCWKEEGSPSLESQVYSLLNEVYTPGAGCSVAFIAFPQERLVLQSPRCGGEELPLFDFPLRQLFSLLGVERVIQLFTCLLLENQILLCSGEYQRLMLVAESLSALLLPFSWPHVYVPILPASCHHFLDAPLPFVMGLHTRESRVNVPSEANLCYMDLDTGALQTPEELPSFPDKTDFALEICEVLKRHKVTGEFLDLNLNSSGDNLMTSSCTSLRRKHSWADELEDDPSLTQGSEFLQRIVPLAKRGGFSHDSALDDDWDSMVDDGFSEESEICPDAQYVRDMKINNAIRELFLNRFVQMFSSYEYFIIQPNQDREEWLNNRDSMQNFDKATFLSDLPQHHLPFLSRFIETQMFATLIDNKILSNWGPLDSNLRVFETRIKLLRNKITYDVYSTICDSQRLLEKRLTAVDSEVPPPKELLPSNRLLRHNRATPGGGCGSFPLLDCVQLSQEPLSQRTRKRSSRLSSSYSSRSFEALESSSSPVEGEGGQLPLSMTASWRSGTEARPLLGGDRLSTLPPPASRQPPPESSPKLIALSNWEFIEILLKECKQKTKRLLVEKLGSEAVEMGHGAQSSFVEENTLIASLCDLIERVWSNGLQRKQGKSALWSHLLNFLEKEDSLDSSKSSIDLSGGHMTPEPGRRGLEMVLASFKTGNIKEIASVIAYNLDLSSSSVDGSSSPESRSNSPRSRSESRTSNTRRLSEDVAQEPTLRPLPTNLVYDLRSVQAMTDIKTQVGYARAFVRLALEKKMLSRHLRTLLSDTALLRSLYKRTAFLRCEEEKEQFLYHLLTLNAVEYSCFTNAYVTTRIPYRVAIFPSRKSSFSSTTANCWIHVYGSLGETGRVPVPKGNLSYVFHHKNLGFLTTLKIGHDNTGLSPKWLVEYIIVRNEVTGHTYNFPCGRWLGKGIDDDSTERLLVGEREKELDRSRGGGGAGGGSSRLRSPSVPPPKRALPLAEIHHMLGECINCLVKELVRAQAKEKTNPLTWLLCGDTGLVSCLEHVFLFGFKSSRLFGRNLYVWDYIVKVREELETSSQNNGNIGISSRFCTLVDAIMNAGHNVGKDGKFQIFVCLSVREHELRSMIQSVLAPSKATLEMFEENSFFRDRTQLNYIYHLLACLDGYEIILENSLTYGITY